MTAEKPKLLKSSSFIRKLTKPKKYRLPAKNSERNPQRIHELDFLNFMARIQS